MHHLDEANPVARKPANANVIADPGDVVRHIHHPRPRHDPRNLMNITPLRVDLIPQLLALMDLGKPYVKARTASDYWLFATLFSSTCPTALVKNELAATVIAFRSQDDPHDVYIQDVMTHPHHRRRGMARTLISHVRDQAAKWNCRRLYLTSEPENTAAQSAWESMGFTNAGGDRLVNGVPVIKDSKDPARIAPSTNS